MPSIDIGQIDVTHTAERKHYRLDIEQAAAQVAAIVRMNDATYSSRPLMFTLAPVISMSVNELEFRIWDKPFRYPQELIDHPGDGLVASYRGDPETIREFVLMKLGFLASYFEWRLSDLDDMRVWLGKTNLGLG